MRAVSSSKIWNKKWSVLISYMWCQFTGFYIPNSFNHLRIYQAQFSLWSFKDLKVKICQQIHFITIQHDFKIKREIVGKNQYDCILKWREEKKKKSQTRAKKPLIAIWHVYLLIQRIWESTCETLLYFSLFS